jgi:hypothetical protein
LSSEQEFLHYIPQSRLSKTSHKAGEDGALYSDFYMLQSDKCAKGGCACDPKLVTKRVETGSASINVVEYPTFHDFPILYLVGQSDNFV